jgi:hypothetical protein
MLERLAQSALSYQRQIKEMSECLDQNQQRIEELERENKLYQDSIEMADIAGVKAARKTEEENKRLDAALEEISLGVVAPMDFARKAREGE